MVMVFDCTDGEMIFSRRTEDICTICGFCSASVPGLYRFYTIFDSIVILNEMKFDISVMSFAVLTFKPTGSTIHRKAIDAVSSGSCLYVSSTTGDLCVYDVDEKSFKGSLKLDGESISFMANVGKDQIAVSTGSGSVIIVEAADCRSLNVLKSWKLTTKSLGNENISGISSNRKGDLFISTSIGRFHRIDSQSDDGLSELELQLIPSLPLVGCLIGSQLLLGLDSGQVSLWDIEKLQMVTNYPTRRSVSPVKCMSVSNSGTNVYCGFLDGSISVFGPTTVEIPIAHRGAVSAIAATNGFFASGGEDGMIRVWKGTKAVTEFTTVGSPVEGIAILDECIYVYTLKREVIQISLKKNRIFKKLSALALGGNMVGMTVSTLEQRDSVLVTAHYDGKCVVWDFDYDHPLKVFRLTERVTCICSYGTNKVLLGTSNGGIASISIDEVDSESLVEPRKYELSKWPIVCVSSSSDSSTVMINSHGLVMIM